MSGASNVLDPVEAAQDDINRSKRVIASALDDLTLHHGWLEGYHREERRRAERLKREKTLQALKLRRQRAAWLAQRYARTTYRVTRATALFLARNGEAFLVWAAPRAEASARIIAKESAIALAWSWRTGRILAADGYDATARGFAWSVRTSEALGVTFRARLSEESARLYSAAVLRAEPILRPTRKRASATWTRARLRSKRLAAALHARAQSVTQAGADRAAQAWSWSALEIRHVMERRARPNKHRALIVRQCTALVRFEPPRARLPALRAN